MPAAVSTSIAAAVIIGIGVGIITLILCSAFFHEPAPPLPAALVDQGTSGILHREGRHRPDDRILTSDAN